MTKRSLIRNLNAVHRHTVSRVLLSAAVFCGITFFAGCSTMRVESTPPDATVMWSSDGLHYKTWPPNSWEWRDHSKSSQTPFRTQGIFGDSILITVEKDGYLTPLPQLAELYGFRREKLKFELSELSETADAKMRAKGFLFYQGKWVEPQSAGVVEYKGVVMKKADAEWAEKLAMGLVEYNGKWYEPKQALALEEKDKLAAGFVLHKERWVLQEEAETEQGIDEEVAEIVSEKVYQDLAAPKFVGHLSMEEVQVQLYNSSSQQIRFLFSGPTSHEFLLEPYRSLGVRGTERLLLESGRYDVVVIPTGIDVTGRQISESTEGLPVEYGFEAHTESQWATWPLPSGTLVSFDYSGSAEGLDMQSDEFEFTLPDPKIDIPQIDIPKIEQKKEKQKRPSVPGAQGRGWPR